MSFKYKLLLPLLLIFNLGYAQEKSLDPITLADSLIHLVLQQEGLFTFYSGLKPISTVNHFSYDIDSLSGEYLDEEKVKINLSTLSNSLNLLQNDSIGYTVLPFKTIHGSKKSFEILIYHKTAVRKLISAKSDFFLKRGILPTDNIEKVLAIYEFEDKHDRYRAYGYLFGYPDHAVDFFVNAAKSQENGGDFVARDFYQIPVASGKDGRFVYAVPKGYGTQEVDDKLKAAAGNLLSKFQADWEAYENQGQGMSERVNLNFLYFLSNH